MVVSTIGYEGQTIDRFIDALIENGIDTIVDVRKVPLSRKKGFSKTALTACLEERGLNYYQMRSLGCPNDIRDDYKIDKDWSKYKVRYNKFLKEQADEVEHLANYAKSTSCALLCFEANALQCHRSLITKVLRAEKGFDVKHLKVGATQLKRETPALMTA
jgi:uncharacterized protein (DUF488 family)